MREREIAWSDITVGQEILLRSNKGHGQGGVVRWVGPIAIGLACGTARIHQVHWRSQWDFVVVEEYLDADECLNYRDGSDCRGPVDYRWTGGSSSWPRCEKHWDERMKRRENSMEIYADSDVVPDWFDPSYAGERWDDD